MYLTLQGESRHDSTCYASARLDTGKELLCFYTTCIRPVTEYACQVFCQMASLSTYQRKLKDCSGVRCALFIQSLNTPMRLTYIWLKQS